MPVTIVEPEKAQTVTVRVRLSSCPVCSEMPVACTCLRPSVRRRIARELR